MNGRSVILIIDDDKNDIDIITNVLGKELNVIYSLSGQTGIDILKNVKVDLILLDILMPEMNGFGVCKIIKEDNVLSKIPIIFLTAKNDSESIIKGFEHGAVDYITKPFEIYELKARVMSHLELKLYKERLENNNIILEEMVKERTKELEIARDQAEDANQKKIEFVGNINHELRTPLNGIVGLTEVLKMAEEDRRKIEMLDHILSCSETLLNQIEALIDFSSIKMNKYVEVESEFNFEEKIIKIFEYFSSYAKKKGLEYLFINKIEKTLYVKGFSDKLQLIIINILSNAIKFTQNGVIKLIIDEILEKDEKKYIRLVIVDTGKGMTESELSRITESFFIQGEFYMTKRYGGLGIGLRFVKEIMDGIGGEINIRSKSAEGTTVTILFPVK